MTILVSACLTGENCKYSGGHNYNPHVMRYLEGKEYLVFCPETACGLPVPRPPLEIKGGSGENVLAGKAKVVDQKGRDFSADLTKSAYMALEICRKHDATEAILKEGSPSCGVHTIYDGNFGGEKIKGRGVTAALLADCGIRLISEKDIEKGNV